LLAAFERFLLDESNRRRLQKNLDDANRAAADAAEPTFTWELLPEAYNNAEDELRRRLVAAKGLTYAQRVLRAKLPAIVQRVSAAVALPPPPPPEDLSAFGPFHLAAAAAAEAAAAEVAAAEQAAREEAEAAAAAEAEAEAEAQAAAAVAAEAESMAIAAAEMEAAKLALEEAEHRESLASLLPLSPSPHSADDLSETQDDDDDGSDSSAVAQYLADIGLLVESAIDAESLEYSHGLNRAASSGPVMVAEAHSGQSVSVSPSARMRRAESNIRTEHSMNNDDPNSNGSASGSDDDTDEYETGSDGDDDDDADGDAMGRVENDRAEERRQVQIVLPSPPSASEMAQIESDIDNMIQSAFDEVIANVRTPPTEVCIHFPRRSVSAELSDMFSHNIGCVSFPSCDWF
jgi:hypothetical protein